MIDENGDLILRQCLVCARFGCLKEHDCDEKTMEFIRKARVKQGWTYNYEKVKYVRSKDAVIISCFKHGEFKQRLDCHLNRGHGCSKCSGKYCYTTSEWIKKAEAKHGNKYNYSKVEYRNSFRKVTIICPKHGEFKQTSNEHLRGNGCPKCSGSYRYTTNEWIELAKAKHGDKYNYSKVEYRNSFSKVTIICPKHGEFKQRPDCHLNRGHGCSKCSQSRAESWISLCLGEIKHQPQYRIKNHPFKYDFFIPHINTIIEYDGEQHFKADNYYNKKGKGIEFQKRRDLTKTKIALKNGYYIVRIPYTTYKRIPKILSDVLANPRNLIATSENQVVSEIYSDHRKLIAELEISTVDQNKIEEKDCNPLQITYSRKNQLPVFVSEA